MDVTQTTLTFVLMNISNTSGSMKIDHIMMMLNEEFTKYYLSSPAQTFKEGKDRYSEIKRKYTRKQLSTLRRLVNEPAIAGRMDGTLSYMSKNGFGLSFTDCSLYYFNFFFRLPLLAMIFEFCPVIFLCQSKTI